MLSRQLREDSSISDDINEAFSKETYVFRELENNIPSLTCNMKLKQLQVITNPYADLYIRPYELGN